MQLPVLATVLPNFAGWLLNISRDRLRFISDEKRVRLAIRELIVPPLHRQQSLRFLHTNLGSLYKSLVNDTSPNLKHLRRNKHTQHANLARQMKSPTERRF